MRLRLIALFLSAASLTLVDAQNAPAPANLPKLNDGTSTSKTGTATKTTGSSTKTDSLSTSITSAPATTAPPAAGLPGLSSKSYDGIKSAPKVSGVFSYPAPTVPPTANAPFMQKSNLPQGTVFICVGAILGFFACLFLAWRGMVAWSLHRSVKRANNPSYSKLSKKYKLANESASILHGPNAPFYAQRPGSSMSLDPLNGSKSPYKSNNNTGSLFFSPTAGTGMHSSHGNRASVGGYLPAGYYAAGASSVGGGLAGNGRPISMADFTGNTPQSQGYQRAQSVGPSPPASPSLRSNHPNEAAAYGRLHTSAGLSTLSLGNRSEGRAPSAYLEDLFDYPPVPNNNGSERGRH